MKALASDVKSVADELDELHDLLKSIGETGGIWEGEAAQKFQSKLGELPKYLKQGTESMRDCAKALNTWHTQLAAFQKKAKALEADALEARRKAEQADKAYEELCDRYSPYFGKPIEAEKARRIDQELRDARARANETNDTLKEIIRKAEKLHAEWKDRAGEAERAILKASENHPPDLHWWDRALDGLKSAWRDFTDWLVENADLLSTISSALAAAALAVNILPIGGQAASAILGGASALFAAGAMAGHWIGNARGNGTPARKIGLDALGVIPGVGGAAKGITAVVKGAKMLDGVRAGGKGIVEGITNPMSQKVIDKVARMFGKELPAIPTQLAIKGGSTLNGIYNLVFGDDDKSTPAAQPQPKNTRTMPAPASGPFLRTAAA